MSVVRKRRREKEIDKELKSEIEKGNLRTILCVCVCEIERECDERERKKERKMEFLELESM